MRDETKAKIVSCVAGLHEAVLDAGGDPRGMLDMTLAEFVTRVAAQNEIRFVHWPTYLRRRTREEEDEVRGDVFSVGDEVYDVRNRGRVGTVSGKESLRVLVRWKGERECWIHVEFARLRHETTGDPLLDDLLEEHESAGRAAQS